MSTDYTPTTEEVRGRYQAGSRNQFGHRDPRRLTDIEFDRWLSSIKADAWDEGFRVGWGSPLLAPILGNPHRMES